MYGINKMKRLKYGLFRVALLLFIYCDTYQPIIQILQLFDVVVFRLFKSFIDEFLNMMIKKIGKSEFQHIVKNESTIC